MALRHIVLFRVHDEVDELRIEQAMDSLRALARLPSVRSWSVARSLDERKGRIVIEDAAFDDAESFEVFRASPEHVSATQTMAEIADWWVGDYVPTHFDVA
ncbi:Dabb family protein [Microbacterium sp. HD4P20]|uniref:Dabb family protein n=1 Tax=Microbacterium sp. HD4P20 TaxID=2864874 RepID=UPI001C644BA9|nr:Dabb family protein [Microbacterium sp. HD4P20]MCP2638102.1 Dabb family protein [Microbacterium sp. HD4P20]